MSTIRSANALEIDVRASFPGFSLAVALTVAPAECLALVGPSGAGKSTLLAIIAGLHLPDQGRVALGSEEWNDTARGLHRPPHERHVGFVHQDYALFPHLSVRANISYGARARKHSHADSLARTEEWMRRLEIADLADRTVLELSGGQRQRVALARALVSGARVLLLDEPFGSLDASTRGSVRSELATFLDSVHLPSIFVTHDVNDALVLADRIAVLENGRLTQIGQPQDLLSAPRSRFVSDLIGDNPMGKDAVSPRRQR